MKTKLLFFTILATASSAMFAQEPHQVLSLEFAFGINGYSMDQINENYIDDFTAQDDINLLDDRIESGQHFRLGLNYQPSALFDLGFYGSYQFGNSTSQPVYTETDELGSLIQSYEGRFELRTEAIGVGASATLYLSHLLKFQEKTNSLKHFRFGLEANGGIGFSRGSTDLNYKTPNLPQDHYYFSSSDFQGMLALKAEYELTRSPLFTSLGLRFGYQFFQTNTLKDRQGNEWVVNGEHPIDLNFSGLYFGTYLKLGR